MAEQRSVGTVLAAALLLVLALPFAGMGVVLLNEVLVRGHAPGGSTTGGSGGVFEVLVVSGLGLLLVASIHLGAAALAWRGPLRAGSPAQRVGWAGVIFGLAALAMSLFGAPDVAAFVLPFPVGYGAVLVCLRSAQER